MGIQYSGNAQTATFTPTTKQNIIDNVETALLAAGWTTVSGHATTNLLMQSATTPQGFAIRVRLKDNSGTCVTFSIESTDGVVVGSNTTSAAGGYLNPNSGGWVYRIICNKYQAFIFATPIPGASRSFVAFGVPFVPSWVASMTTRIGWCEGMGASDTDTTQNNCFRIHLAPDNNTGNCGAQQIIYNGTTWSRNDGSANVGELSLASMGGFTFGTPGTAFRWANGDALVIDAIVGWGTTSSTGECVFLGQLWDSAIFTDSYTADLTATFDSHNWQVITHLNTGANQNSLRGSLLVATS